MNTYLVEVETTSAMGNTVNLGESYIECSNGKLFINANRIEDVCILVPSEVIKRISLVGVGYTVERVKG